MTDSEIAGECEGAEPDVEDSGEAEESLHGLEDQLKECEERAESYLDRLQRLQADFANYKKRNAKETMESIEYAKEDIILSLLDVVDNFERALESIPPDSDADTTKKGIEMILRQFRDVLEKEGVSLIDADGQTFDPYLHETIARVTCDAESGTVVEVMQCGYKLKSKVIRPSMVKVAE